MLFPLAFPCGIPTVITTLCVACQFLKSAWQQEDVKCHSRSDLSSRQLAICDKYSLETSDLTYSLRSSSIILPIPISCRANVTGWNSFPTNGTGGLRLSGGLLPGVVRAEGRWRLDVGAGVEAVRGGRALFGPSISVSPLPFPLTTKDSCSQLRDKWDLTNHACLPQVVNI